jgi:hypothetical protein
MVHLITQIRKNYVRDWNMVCVYVLFKSKPSLLHSSPFNAEAVFYELYGIITCFSILNNVTGRHCATSNLY